MPAIDELPATPRHTIQVVAEATGIPAVTLRMWERRYGVVRPTRSGGNYRLYSERDIALLRWLKQEVDNGSPIRHAAADLKRRAAAGDWPQALPALRPRHGATPPESVVRDLFTSLVEADERRARQILRQAGTQYDLDTLCLRILTPCLVEIGEAWHRGEVRVAQEHFASSYLRGHLLSLYQAYPLRRGALRAFVGCAPSEQHEIGALMLALFLRRGGFRVDYLGANLDTADVIDYTRAQRPALVALSAATEGPALALERTAAGLARLRPRPLVGFGGRAFNLDPGLRRRPAGRFLGEDAATGAASALQILGLRAHPKPYTKG
jgi:DNA-binding transcriptional MerR regulator